ncbi:MAG: hydroxyacid dehydrogenase [Alphaproteobacteria bacterium]|jgi:D-3-phosphoglycerate dehydrogenase / 2-oxoglutarate reductase|nr:hydroxyacid dehydrogenase [Alphaproteobacteria bacterium]
MPAPWVALTGIADLPIAEPPARQALDGVAEARVIGLPYKPLKADEEAHWAGELQGAGGILLRSGYITASLLDRLPDLKIVAVHGAGVDPVDIEACTARGVQVTNAPGANANAVAELVFGLMLAHVRQIPASAHKAMAEKAWDAARHTGGELRGRALGLVGFGQIGKRVATIAQAFGMTVIASDPVVSDADMQTAGVQPMQLNDLLAASDMVSLHAPAIPATRHMINAKSIALMKSDACLINCARGALVDEVALAAALRAGQLGGAALDVLDGEPPDPASPIYGAPNMLLTPHMAGSTFECLDAIAATTAADIARALKGEQPVHPVNKV